MGEFFAGLFQQVLNGAAVELDVPPQIVNSLTKIPVRFVGEGLEVDVQWHPDGFVVINTALGFGGTSAPYVPYVPAEVTPPAAASYTLFSGEFTVGQDIPAGRYVITSDGSGNFTIHNADGRLVINEILNVGGGADAQGVPSITVDINYGYEINIRGISNVDFTPAVNEVSTVLSTGHWIVGVHIPAGQFDARPTTPGDSGNLIIHNIDGRLATNEILRDRVRVNLQNGAVIRIGSLTSVTFEQV